MAFAIGVVLFAIGILISLALHEAGHMGTARAFGMKVTRYFIGFGPTLFSFRRKDTEYGVKAVPAGAFVKIVGMTPQDDDVDPTDEHRAMWRYPVWKRTIVLAAGSLTHFILAVLILWGLFSFVPLGDEAAFESNPPTIRTVSQCVALEWEIDEESNAPRECVAGEDPDSAAYQAGLRPGDTIVAFDGSPVTGWTDLTGRIEGAGGETVPLTYERDGEQRTVQVALPLAERPDDTAEGTPVTEVTEDQLEEVGMLGITPEIPRVRHGPVAGVGLAVEQTGSMFKGTFEAIGRLPSKIPPLAEAVFGGERDPEGPISVVGASRIGGSLWEQGEVAMFLLLLAGLNFFVGIFNLVPLLPLDGGHIAIAWFERARSWLYARLRRPDPGRVDYYKMMPVTYVVILIMAGFFLLTIAADIVNPIRI
jgi:membrane-associated protease RseP (regulator of RpoE activity)